MDPVPLNGVPGRRVISGRRQLDAGAAGEAGDQGGQDDRAMEEHRRVAEVDADQRQAPVSMDIYYITPNKCTECQGFHEEPQCAAVCPVDCCVPDEMYRETVDELMGKKEKMHL